MRKIIAIAGKARSGKDTVAKMIEIIDDCITNGIDTSIMLLWTNKEIDNAYEALMIKKSKVKIIGFADKLKEITGFYTGKSVNELNLLKDTHAGTDVEIKRNSYQSIVNPTYRDIMISIADALRNNIDNNFFVKTLLNSINKESNDTTIVINDLRHFNELGSLLKLNAYIIVVNRFERDSVSDFAKTHNSESCDFSEFTRKDFVIDNNEDIYSLFKKVLSIYMEINMLHIQNTEEESIAYSWWNKLDDKWKHKYMLLYNKNHASNLNPSIDIIVEIFNLKDELLED